MFELNEETIKLRGFFENMPSNSYITYADIEKATGVKMTLRGKNHMRSALRHLKREYRSDKGVGIELEGAKNCMELVTGRVKRASNGLKRATKTTNLMQARYLEELPPDDRNRLLATASLFGAVSAMAKGLSQMYKEKVPSLNTMTSKSIPKFWEK